MGQRLVRVLCHRQLGAAYPELPSARKELGDGRRKRRKNSFSEIAGRPRWIAPSGQRILEDGSKPEAPERMMTRAQRGIAAMLLSAGILIAVITTLVRNYPELPPAAGSFLVGTTRWDAALRSAAGSASHAGRCSVTVQLWYPAEAGTGVGPAPYEWGDKGLLSAARWVESGANLDAAVSDAQARYPVLLYFPQWGGGPVPYAAMARDLASRGFIVALVGYDAPDCAGPDGAATSAHAADLDFSSAAAFERTVKIADTKITLVAASAAKVLDALDALDHDDPGGRFTGRLDLGRTAAIGHSLGGSIALEVAWLDARIKAAIDLDGWLFDAARGGWPRQPVLVVSSDGGATPTTEDPGSADPNRRYPSILDIESDHRIQAAFAKFGGVEATIGDSMHEDFSDSPYLARGGAFLGRHPDGHVIRAAVDCTVTFLESVFRGDASLSCKASNPNVKVVAHRRPSSGAPANAL
jgi:dienelactone hydrolase